MATSSGGGYNNVATEPKAQKKRKTKEKTCPERSPLQYILFQPDKYIGLVEAKVTEQMWIYDMKTEQMVQKQIKYVPGLYEIFDVILVNAAENKKCDTEMNCIKIDIDAKNNTISIWSNGQSLPGVLDNEFIPNVVFQHLLAYYHNEENVTDFSNDCGARLCNIFSTKFTVETASGESKRHYIKTWEGNMTKTSQNVKSFFGTGFTKITFSPDLDKLKMNQLDDDIIGLMSRRAYDIAATTRGVKVILNGKKLPVENFKDYVNLYIKSKEDYTLYTGNNLKVIYDNPNEQWEVAMTLSDRGFQQISLVNSIATTKGGCHVDHVVGLIANQTTELLKKENKESVQIKPHQVKSQMWIFINCLIVNPTFDSPTKEYMTLHRKSFDSKCLISEEFIIQVSKSGIAEAALWWAKMRIQNELAKGVPKLEDANEAGTRNALKCTLILTEGDSAKSLAVHGLSIVGRDHYGVYPLRGKLLNVREATHKQIMENQEINDLMTVLGLVYKRTYNTEENKKLLRYGKIMMMTDQNPNGSHSKGLIINFIHENWPELLRQNFLEEFITPIIKARKCNQVLSFFSLPEFEEWKNNTSNYKSYAVEYYKGLGSFDHREMLEYFSNLDRHRICFCYKGLKDDDHIVLAFSKNQTDRRKKWLKNFMAESRRRKEIGLPEKFLYTKDTKFVSFTDFINLELVLFSLANNIRSIPSVVDGLKPDQRKVMYTMLKHNIKSEMNLVQLNGAVLHETAYHDGEASLDYTIMNLAQNFVGSNNVNLLVPCGQFGTRLLGGKDCFSPHYLATKLSPLARMIFHPDDDPLLKYEFEGNQKVEPYWYIPIIPMILVNGAKGTGTNWMTKIPNFNPRELVQNLRFMLDGNDPAYMLPWYKHFKGTIEDCNNQRFVINGEIAVTGNEKVEITELPIGTWSQIYRDNFLKPLLYKYTKEKANISDYKDFCSDTTIKYEVTFLPGQLKNLEKVGLHQFLKLQSVFKTGSMCAFDEFGCIKQYHSVTDILNDFYQVRLDMYQKRKDYIEGKLKAEVDLLDNQVRFIRENCNGQVVVENKKRKAIIDELIKRGYKPDPVKEWKRNIKADEDEEAQPDEEAEAEDDEKSNKITVKEELIEVKKLDYLLGMPMWMLTDEKKNQLLRQKDIKLVALNALEKKSKADLWREDMDQFLVKLSEVENMELEDTNEVQYVLGTMPSAAGRRIKPIINDDLKKKNYQTAKTRENRRHNPGKKESTAYFN